MELNPELEVIVDEVAELEESAPELVVEPVAEVTVEEPDAKTYKGRKSAPAPVVVEPTVEPEPEASETLEDPNPKNLPAGNIWTYNCEIPVQLPESFYLTCADGGWYVYNIKWQSWGETEAKATAMYSENVCEPNCAEGYRVEAPVELTISTSAKLGKKIYLTDLVMTASTEKNFNSGDRGLTWDLGEFAKMMESN
jgi:hypothetical protein